MLNIVEILKGVETATNEAKLSASAAASSAGEAKAAEESAAAMALRVSTEGLILLNQAAKMIVNTDVDQIAQTEWKSPSQGAVIHGGTLTCKQPRLAYAPEDSLKHSTFWMTSDEAGENVIYPMHTEAGLSHELKIHLMKPNTTYFAFSNQTTDKGAVSRKTTPLKLVTADVLQFIKPPVINAPQAGTEVMWNGVKVVIAPPVVEPGGTLQQDKIEVKFSVNGVEQPIVTVNAAQAYVDLPTLARKADIDLQVRVYDRLRGRSDWSEVREFRTKNVEHGMRVDGGIALGNPDGSPYTYVDGKHGFNVIPPDESVYGNSYFFLDYWKSVPLPGISSAQQKDPNSGVSNTERLMQSDVLNYHSDVRSEKGSYPAIHCANLVYEGCDDFFLMNKEELKDVMQYSGKFGLPVFSGEYHSSTNHAPYTYVGYFWAYNADNKTLFNKARNYSAKTIPCRRILID